MPTFFLIRAITSPTVSGAAAFCAASAPFVMNAPPTVMIRRRDRLCVVILCASNSVHPAVAGFRGEFQWTIASPGTGARKYGMRDPRSEPM
jgi:hypothetical protein